MVNTFFELILVSDYPTLFLGVYRVGVVSFEVYFFEPL